MTPGTSKKRELNIRQQRFAELVAGGMPAMRAYVEAGYSDRDGNAESHACRLVEHGGVKALIAKLRQPQTKAATLSKEEKLAFLAAIVRTPIGEIGPDSPLCAEFVEESVADGSARGRLRRGNQESGNEVSLPPVRRIRVKTQDKLKALELHSKLVGDFEPDQHVIETGPKTLESILERARRVASLMSIAPPELTVHHNG